MATVKGVWVFNETLTNPNGSLTVDPLNFSSNGENFYAITARDTMQAYGLLYDMSPASGTGAGQFAGKVIYTFNGSSYTDLPPNTWAKEAYRTVDFGTTERNVGTSFYNWLTANATQRGVTITYNGSVIASLEAGQTATLECAGKKAVTDIVVAFGGAGSITYNGTATEVEAGKTVTLQCAGKKFKTDIAVSYEVASTNFTLSDGSILLTSDGQIFNITEE